jgi:hypothetical protein
LVANEFAAQRFKVLALATTAVWVCVALIIPPLVAPAFPAQTLFTAVQSDLRPEMEFGAMDFTEPSLVWYFRSRVKGWMTTLDRESVKPFMEKSGPRFVVVPTNLLADFLPNPPSNWKTLSARGFNVAKWKHVDLSLILKSE